MTTNLVPGKLYRATKEIWALNGSGRAGVIIDGDAILLFVQQQPTEQGEHPAFVCDFINLDGEVVILHKQDTGSHLVGPL